MIVVTGASGQLGFELQRLLGSHGIFLDRRQLDLGETQSIENVIGPLKPKLLINAAAYTAVDKAEAERDLAFKINCDAPAKMAKLAKEMKFKFVHISTDYVFNGNSSKPYIETDLTDPINTYGESKCRGEEEVLSFNSDALIVRTSWVYSSHGKNFVKTVLRIAQERKVMKVVNDQVGTLTWAHDLAETLLAARDLQGIFHYSNEGKSSWYEVACAIVKLKGLDLAVEPISTQEYPTPAKRPAFSLLNKNKIKSSLGLNIPHWMESLEKCLKELS